MLPGEIIPRHEQGLHIPDIASCVPRPLQWRSMSLTLRYLRITWTGLCGIACVLLVVLWVRSYWRVEHFLWNRTAESFCVSIYPGQVALESINGPVMMPMGWSHVVFPHSGDDSISDDEPTTILGFGWKTDDDSINVYIPFWFSVLVFAALATVPWHPWRFSLRTLLIATTLVAVVLGTIVWAVR
jgi:hypothetical protein